MIYALDTNIIIHYLHNETNVHRNFDVAVEQNCRIIIPKIVDYEMRRGFSTKPKPKKEKSYKILTEICIVTKMTDVSWEMAVRVYADLYRKRFTVGEMDILIASFCLANDCTLVTNNTSDFKNIDKLRLVDWTMKGWQI